MGERTVKTTLIPGAFRLPLGLHFFREGRHPKCVLVSTVCREGAHLEDRLGWLSPEHGFETMVFLDGSTFFSVYTAEYKTRQQARRGHASIVKKLLAGTLPLAIELKHYAAFGAEDSPQAEIAHGERIWKTQQGAVIA